MAYDIKVNTADLTADASAWSDFSTDLGVVRDGGEPHPRESGP